MLLGRAKAVFSDAAHGLALKASAFIARAAFVLIVVPDLLVGELASYAFINATGVLIAMVLILGLNVELPRIIGDDFTIARHFFPWFYFVELISLGFFAAAVFVGGELAAIGFFSVTILGGRLLSGILRSIDAEYMERIQNLPWILFMAASLLVRPTTAFELINWMAISMHVVFIFSIIHASLTHPRSQEHHAYPTLLSLTRKGLLRGGIWLQISNLGLVGLQRGLILWPVWLGLELDLDEIALLLLVGGMFLQFGLIPVHRSYSRWCRKRPSDPGEWKMAVYTGVMLSIVLFLTYILALLVVNKFGFGIEQIPSFGVAAQAAIFFSLMPLLLLLRYFLWSLGLLEKEIAWISIGLFLTVGVVVYSLPAEIWFLAAAIPLLLVSGLATIQSKRAFISSLSSQD